MRRYFPASLPLLLPAKDQPQSKVRPSTPLPWHFPQLGYLCFVLETRGSIWQYSQLCARVHVHVYVYVCVCACMSVWGEKRRLLVLLSPELGLPWCLPNAKRPFPWHWRHFRGRHLSSATPVLLELPLSPSPSPLFCFSLLCRWQRLKGCLCPPRRRVSGWATL